MDDIDNSGSNYKVYGYRWVVLGIYALNCVLIQIMWTTFFSITTDAWHYYGFTDAVKGNSAISMLSVIFMEYAKTHKELAQMAQLLGADVSFDLMK